MTIAGNQGQNVYPSPDNYATSSFPQKVPAPSSDPDAGTLVTVQYGRDWQEVLMAAVDQLLNPATWEGDHDAVILALNRATNFKDMLQTEVVAGGDLEAPYYDDATDVGDSAPEETQTWYGTFTDVLAPAAELDFVENALVFVFSGLLAIGVAPSVGIAFKTIATSFVIAQKAGDIGELIRIVVDGKTDITVDTTGHAGEIIETPIYADPRSDLHQVYVMKVS